MAPVPSAGPAEDPGAAALPPPTRLFAKAQFVNVERDRDLENRIKSAERGKFWWEWLQRQLRRPNPSAAVVACLKAVLRETGQLPETIKRCLDWIEPLPDRLTLWECVVHDGDAPVGEKRVLMVRGSAWTSTYERGRPPNLRLESSTPPKLSYWDGKEFRRSRTTSSEAAATAGGLEALRQRLQDCLPLTVQLGEQTTLFVATFEAPPKFTQSLRQQGAPVYGLNLGWQETSRRWMDDDERLEAAAELGLRRFHARTPITSLFCNWTMETSALLTTDCPSDHPVLRAWGLVTTPPRPAQPLPQPLPTHCLFISTALTPHSRFATAAPAECIRLGHGGGALLCGDGARGVGR